VRLDGAARQIARGGAGLRLIDSIQQKAALEAAGTVADGNRPDGSTPDGTAAEDEVLVPGGVASLVTSGYTPAGSGGVFRSLPAKLGEQWASTADYSGSDTLLNAAAGRAVVPVALSTQFNGPDVTPQFEVGWTPGASEYWRSVGGILGAGPTLVAWSQSAANVDGSFVAKGGGGHYFSNGLGVMGAVEDNGLGSRYANYAALRPGNAGSPAQIAARSWGGETNVGIALTPMGTGAISIHVPDNTAAGGSARGSNAVDLQAVRSQNNFIAAGTNSALLGGSENIAFGTNSVCAGGNLNNADGTYSWVPGGQRGRARGLYGRGAWGSGRFSSGVAPVAFEQVMRAQTTGTTAVRLSADGTAASTVNILNIADNSACLVRLLVLARQTGGSAGTAGDFAAWDLTVPFKRNTGAASVVVLNGSSSVAPTYSDAASAAWRLNVSGDTSNGTVQVIGTGETNKNIDWVARVVGVELAP
jgi:hypothetical protein